MDFYLFDKANRAYRCEVKLMGKGNPESADAVEARQTDVFVADTLSAKARKWLSDKSRERPVYWLELRAEVGFKKFEEILQSLQIPYKPFKGDLVKAVNKILASIPDEVVEEMAQKSDASIADAL